MSHPIQENGSLGASPNPKKRGTWFRNLLLLIAAVGAIYLYDLSTKNEMRDVVETQIESLQNHQYSQAYYEFTSKGFQKNTSLENFKAFLKVYDVLADNKAFVFEEEEKSGTQGIVSGNLISRGLKEMKVDFHLVKEEGAWKVESIRLKEAGNTKESLKEPLVQAVNQQLEAIRKQNLLDAYYGYFTQEFQSETPYAEFESYVRDHPVFSSYTDLQFKDPHVEDSTGKLEAILESNQGTFHLEYKLKKVDNDWKIWNVRLVLPPQESEKQLFQDPSALAVPVRHWLDDILLNHTEHAYRETAQEFRDTTPFSSFKEFIESHPALTHRDLTDIRPGKIENGVGKLLVHLHDETGPTTMEFKLGYDEGAWKIWGIEVVSRPDTEQTEGDQPSDALDHGSLAKVLTQVIENQLQALKYHDYEKAYREYTSKQFQENVSLPEFEQLVASAEVLNRGRYADFERMEQKGRLISLKGEVTTLDYDTYPVNYDLVKESNDWKIQGFAVQKSPEPKKKEELYLKGSPDIDVPFTDIKKITVSDEIDADGVISTPRIVIDTDTKFLYFNVYIEDGIEGSDVTLHLNHVDSGSEAPPISIKLKNAGNTIVSFSYEAPLKGWPEGNYIAKVNTSTDDEHLQGFVLRKGEKKLYSIPK